MHCSDSFLTVPMKHMGPRALAWPTQFYMMVINSNTILKKWQTAKFIVVQMPRKDPILAVSYWLISLLSALYKILECLILQCISQIIEEVLSNDQTVSTRTSAQRHKLWPKPLYVENGFQKNLKTSAVSLDLIVANNTVWCTGFPLKLS